MASSLALIQGGASEQLSGFCLQNHHWPLEQAWIELMIACSSYRNPTVMMIDQQANRYIEGLQQTDAAVGKLTADDGGQKALASG